MAHGNVSPACVLLTSADPRTPGFMSDVRRTTESLPYHSPERMRGGQISPSDDVWAVAATLYTALTAAPPFVGASEVELKQQVLKGSPAPLSVYGVDDERLERLMGMSFAADAGRRLSNVALVRRELERVHPAPAGLEALEDEEVGDEDQAATAMLPLGKGADSAGSASMKALFAPPSFQADSATALGRSGGASFGGTDAPKPSSGDFDTNPPPPAAGDATVMRELPAHIMAMAARAASGRESSPPAADKPQEQPPSAPKPAAGTPPSAPRPMAAPRVPQFGPGAQPNPISAAATVAVPAPPRPQAPVAPVAPVAPIGPRPGFAPPPATADTAPRDPDDVRTVMHAGDIRSLLDPPKPPQPTPPGTSPFGPASPPRPQPPQPPGRPQAPLPPAPPVGPSGTLQPGAMQAPLGPGNTARPVPPTPNVRSTVMGIGAPAPQLAPPVVPSASSSLEEEDEDDGARTVMRESPILSPLQMAPRPAAGAPPPSPLASPPRRASQDEPTQTEGEFLAEPSFIVENSFSGAAPPANPGGWQQAGAPQQSHFQGSNAPTGAGVSALIAEALETSAPNSPNAATPGPSGFQDPAADPKPGFGGFGQPNNAPPNNASPAPNNAPNNAQAGFGAQPGFGGGFPQGQGQQGFNPGAGYPQGGFNPAFGQGAPQQNQFQPGMQGFGDPGGAAQPRPFPTGEPTTSGPAIKLKQGRSYGSLILICVLVLVLAAAVTFIVLKYKDKLGLGAIDRGPDAHLRV